MSDRARRPERPDHQARRAAGPALSHDALLDYASAVGDVARAGSGRDRAVEAVDDLPNSLDEALRLAATMPPGVLFERADLYTLPFEDGAFSLVVCRGAFHRLPEPVAALREMARVLSRGEVIVIVDTVVDEVTDTPLNDLARLREPSHRRLYRPEELAGGAPGRASRDKSADRRRTIDLGYWLQAADVSSEKGDLIRSRFSRSRLRCRSGSTWPSPTTSCRSATTRPRFASSNLRAAGCCKLGGGRRAASPCSARPESLPVRRPASPLASRRRWAWPSPSRRRARSGCHP